MVTPIRIVAVASIALLATGCQTANQTGGVHTVMGSEFADKAVLGQLSSLEGEWQLVGEDGELGLGSTFALTSAGSAVREIMFAGQPNEMTNFYHMDGQSIVCTHYCAIGNQPRMVTTGMQTNDGVASFDFTTDSVSNFRKEQNHYMGGLKLTLLDANTIKQEWTSFDADGVIASEMVFVMKRVQ